MKGKDDSSSRTALVITAEMVSVSMSLPGIATGKHWQHPVVSEREMPYRSFPMLPHSCAIQSIRLSLLAGRSFLDIQKGPELSWWQWDTALSPTYCSLQVTRHTSAFQTAVFAGGACAGLQRMPSSYTGERRNCALPSPVSPTICPTDGNALSCSSPQTARNPQTNAVQW